MGENIRGESEGEIALITGMITDGLRKWYGAFSGWGWQWKRQCFISDVD